MIANLCIALVAVLHIYFLILEMFFWTKPLGLKIFRLTPEKAQISAPLAANQGLYNGFLASGLIWGLIANDQALAESVKIYFLSCIVIAGAYGGWTVNRKIWWVQAVPAAIALGLVFV